MLTPNIELKNKTVLVTGAAGFIGANLVMELFRTVEGIHIVGVDNVNDYYDTSIKDYRLSLIEKTKSKDAKWTFVKGNIADRNLIDELFDKYGFSVVDAISVMSPFSIYCSRICCCFLLKY